MLHACVTLYATAAEESEYANADSFVPVCKTRTHLAVRRALIIDYLECLRSPILFICLLKRPLTPTAAKIFAFLRKLKYPRCKVSFSKIS